MSLVYKHRRIGGRAGKMRLAHHITWEQLNGPIPVGYQIHHLDHDEQNNDIENLVCITVSDHQKFHSKYYCKLNGNWVKFCKECKEIGNEFSGSYCFKCRASRGRIERRRNSI
jgi:hypothetical protein